VVNNYYAAGLDQKIELKYIGTMIEGSKVRKLWRAMKAYMQFLVQLSGYDIVHVNMASDASYVRKSFFIKAAKRARKKIVIHQHGGDFEGYYGQLSEKGKKRVKEILSMGLTYANRAFLFSVIIMVVVLFFRKGIMGDKELPDLLKKRQKKATKEAVQP